MMSVILRLGAVNTDAPYSRLISEAGEPEAPIDEDLYSSPPQTYPGCFGLPYQDHNYGAPPPPTPPQTPPLAIPPTKESLDFKEEIVVTSDTPTQLSPQTHVTEDAVDLDDPTRCICDFIHDDGYMIQCDKCSVWQHIVCMGLDRDSIPDTYECELCHPRPVDRVRAREFQIRKREFLKTLLIKSHDSSTDTDPEEVNNRLKAYGLDPSDQNRQKQKMKLKKRKERMISTTKVNNKKNKEIKTEKENTSKEANKKNKLLIKDFSSKVAKVKKEKLSKKIEKMRAERLSKEMKEDKLSCDDLREDEKIISTLNTITAPLVQDENAQNPWDINTFNEWEQSYEVARYNQYTTYVQEYLTSACTNGHHNDIADLVTDGLRVQRCHIKELKCKKKGLEASCTIPEGQPVIEVIGKVMTRQQYDKDNFGQRQLSPFVFFYGKLFDLDIVVDASDYGNDARFIRRSCQPNAVVHHVVAGGQAHFIAVATKEVPENTEITIPFDYDYKKWNFCNECACLRNNCPVTRYQKKRLRFQKLQISPTSPKKFIQQGKGLKAVIKSPVKSPVKSPIKSSPTKPIEKIEAEVPPTPETIHIGKDTTTPSPNKMVRRSQVSRQSSNNASTQVSSGRVRSLRVPSQVSSDNDSNVDPVTTPDPTKLRSLEADPLTSPETKTPCKDKEASSDGTDPPKQEKKKLTREERKMEAIMKAFEKMEKRNARKASVDQVKVKEKEKDKDEVLPKKEIKKEKVEPEVEKTEVVEEVKPAVIESPVKEVMKEEVVEKEEVPEVKVVIETIESSKEEENCKPVLRERAPSKGKKAKKTASRRRTRNSSGAAVSCEVKVEPVTEEVSVPAVIPTPVFTESCPSTPCVQAEEIATTPPSFKFLKTKRHLMNEWLHEKESDIKPMGPKSEPLEVSVEEEMFVTCLPSPRNSMDRLRRNSQCGGVRDHHRVGSASAESSVGSAKKRWLRQAMGEGSESGMASPGQASGGMSPNPQAMPSPGGSPPVDFVTPLKKRRLARESLSHDSQSSEAPSSTPTPTSATIPGSGSMFAGLKESFELKVEELRNKNGFNNCPLSPLPATEVTCSASTNNSANINLENPSVSVNPSDCEVNTSDTMTPVSEGTVHDSSVTLRTSPPDEGDAVSSCADIDCNVLCNTGTDGDVCAANSQISINKLEAGDARAEEMDVSEQIPVCDAEQCANSEPDSSGSAVCQAPQVTTPMEVECDSVSMDMQSSAEPVERVEVDSTESRKSSLSVCHMTDDVSEQVVTSDCVASDSDRKQEEEVGEQCDSCNSERLNAPLLGRSAFSQTPTSSSFSSSSSAAARVRTCSSSSNSNVDGSGVQESSDYSVSTGERGSQVGSSTDHSSSRESVSESITVSNRVSNTETEFQSPVATESISGSSMAVDSHSPDNSSSHISGSSAQPPSVQAEEVWSASSNEPVTGSSSRPASELAPSVHERDSALANENDATINSTEDMVSTHISPNLQRSVNLRSTLSASSSQVSSELSPVPNRHLKFLHDTPFSTDMTVDSTTHFMSSLGTSNSSAIQNLSYDSDSMDVTSATDASVNGGVEDGGKSEDPFTNFPESSSGDANHPKEKKKVSLQEYLKRKKDKPGCSGGVSSKVSSVTSTVTTSPLKLTTPINLDKLPPLPSLPSLPMFEKTERKEFKSSSEILSPIFNRKEKTEEVRKHMSLSERLRQEFGLDDSTDTDTDTEKTDSNCKGKDSGLETDVPPPPPPPPPQAPAPRNMKQMQNGSPIPSLLSIKTFPSVSVVKPTDGSNTVPQMVPPPPAQSVNKTTPNKKLLVSPINNSLSNLLASVRTPAQLQTDLTAQLAAIKAQISKVQQSLPTASSSSTAACAVGGTNSSSTDHLTIPVNGVSTTGPPATQVFDYGHQSGGTSNNYLRQNSYPGSVAATATSSSSSSSSSHYHSYKKSSPSPGFNNKVSPRYNKVSPTLPGNQLYNNVNSNGNQSYMSNHQNSRSPSLAWNQKHGSHASSSASRKLYSNQSKYSRSTEK